MFSEDFLEIINKTEKAYNAQNVSEIVKRAGKNHFFHSCCRYDYNCFSFS